MKDAVELARNIKTLHYGEFIDVTEGLLFLTCSECGDSVSLIIKETGPGMQRVRTSQEPDLTAACRENLDLQIPLYRELVKIREQNMQMKHLLEEVQERLEMELMSVGHCIPTNEKQEAIRTSAMKNLKDMIGRIEEVCK